MKAILITSNENDVFSLKDIIKDRFDLIVYSSFIKALDNLLEISPDYVLIDCSEYSRHWKILARYLESPLFNKETKLILLNSETLSDEDFEKSQVLKISNYLDKPFDENTLNIFSFTNSLSKEEPEVKLNNKVVFNHPDTGKILYGTAEKITDLCLKITSDEVLNNSNKEIRLMTFEDKSFSCMITKKFENTSVFEIVRE